MTAPANIDLMPEFSALKSFFDKAKKDLDNGSVTSLSGIDTRITKVCKTAQEVSPELQQKYLPELTGLIDQLNVYERTLRDFQSVQLEKPQR